MSQALPPRKFQPTPFTWHQEIELEITTLTNMGQGLGRVDGWVIMVPYALPGEKIRARVWRNDKNFSEADLVEVLTPSPHRIQPRCSLFGRCGGCQYQHLEYSEQLSWKRRQVQELLQHMVKVEFPVSLVISSPAVWNYRSKITPHFEPRKGQPVTELGFLRAGRRKEIVDVTRCEIATEAINAALPAGRQRIFAREWKRGGTLLLRDTDAGVLSDPNAVAMTSVGGLQFEFLAGDFFQNNPFILETFTTWAVDKARESGAEFLIDAYCGSGLFSLVAARHFTQVTGIEIAATAVARATQNAARNSITNCRFIAGSADKIFEDITSDPAKTAVLIDPPRRGSDDAFLQQLIAYAPLTIIYVSCNPATQMRDLRVLLDGGYQLTAVQPFDLFPHTKHLESITVLQRAAAV